jgi:hypothetical protein
VVRFALDARRLHGGDAAGRRRRRPRVRTGCKGRRGCVGRRDDRCSVTTGLGRTCLFSTFGQARLLRGRAAVVQRVSAGRGAGTVDVVISVLRGRGCVHMLSPYLAVVACPTGLEPIVLHSELLRLWRRSPGSGTRQMRHV